MKTFSGSCLKKLHIGNITTESNVFMAPLAGYTSYPFRMICRKLGAGLAFTEMVSANGLKYNDKATAKLLCTSDAETLKAVQLLGSVPSAFEYACKGEYTAGFDIVDINMGCPVPNVIKSGEGCALISNMPLASKIIEACKRSGKVVTVKFRPGFNRKKIVVSEFAKMCEDSGADMITVHGRTRDMMYEGEPVYGYIEAAKNVVNIPVIANGGIHSDEDAVRMMDRTGADGVMIGRYGLEDPLIFARLTGKDTNETKLSLVLEQADIAISCFDELSAMEHIKKTASYFMKKLPGTKVYKQEMYNCGSMKELKKTLIKIFGETEK
ncbi:tRNA dihydrouridine synthase [Ruminococcus albus]|uniref:tRNA dihydrouridine synthase n=1 Tax=Ruminococcus albus TaxID=1264 RepID=UPI0004B6737B|nr:tRNA-dihydrouridine synthase family protein [Ruminococcus albus]